MTSPFTTAKRIGPLRTLPRSLWRAAWCCSLAGLPAGLVDRIRAEQVNVLATLLGLMAFLGQGSVLLVVYEFWNTEARTMLGWFGTLLILVYVALLALSLGWGWLRSGPANAHAEPARRRFVHLIFGAGACWGVLFLDLIGYADSDQRSLLYAVIIGMMSTAVFLAPASAAFAFWLPVTIAGFLAATVVGHTLDLAGTILLAGYGVLTLLCIIYLNYTLIRRARGEIEQQEGRDTIGLLLRDFEESAGDWLWETDDHGRLTHVSRRFAQAARTDAQSLLGAHLASVAAAPDPDARAALMPSVALSPELAHVMADGQPFRDIELRLKLGTETVWWSLSGKPKFSDRQIFEGYRGVGSDVTSTRRATERARYLAHFDELTGLPNRRLFRETLDAHFQQKTPPSIALVCLDVDRFKAVNDTLGHPVGDALLVAVARRLERHVRASDMCARLGGDEFAMILRHADAALAASIAERIVFELSRPYQIDGQQIEAGVSIGIALAGEDAGSAGAVMQHADSALYQAKEDGRGVARLYDHALRERDLRRRVLQRELPGAIERDELRLEFQPIFNIATRKVTAVEALVRWDVSAHGKLSAPDFVPMAEACGLIDALGDWVLTRACEEARGLPRHVRVAVNVSPLQLRGGHFIGQLRRVLASGLLEPARLELELTETAFLDMTPHTMEILNEVRRLGVRVNLDDFGVGYTSLGHLRRFTFSNLKIDRSFVQDLPGNPAARAVVRGLTAMAAELGIGTIAEGIETDEQLDLVGSIGCEEVQGFLLARPMPMDGVLALIADAARAEPTTVPALAELIALPS